MDTRTPYDLHDGRTHAASADDLTPYSVSPHEAMCKNADGTPCSECGGRIHVSFAVLRRFKRSRDAHGGSVTVSSGYRCNAHQQRLWDEASQADRANGLVAEPGHSPHEYGEALDTLTPDGYTHRSWGQFIVDSNKGDVRVGCNDYGWGAHMDTMFFVKSGMYKGITW